MRAYYELLGVQPGASMQEVKSAYARRRAEVIARGDGQADDVEARLRLLDEALAGLADASTGEQRTTGSPADATVRLPAARAADSTYLPVAQELGGGARVCPYCGGANPTQATMCLACGQQLARPCPKCAQLVPLEVQVCPRCQTVVREYDSRRFTEAAATQQRLQRERRQDDANVEVADAAYRSHIWTTVVFWVVVVCGGVLLLAVLLAQPQLMGR